jgi:hypothetical protein
MAGLGLVGEDRSDVLIAWRRASGKVANKLAEIQRRRGVRDVARVLVTAVRAGDCEPDSTPKHQKITPERWVTVTAWRLDPADLAEMLGRDFGVVAPEKQKLMAMAENKRRSEHELREAA